MWWVLPKTVPARTEKYFRHEPQRYGMGLPDATAAIRPMVPQRGQEAHTAWPADILEPGYGGYLVGEHVEQFDTRDAVTGPNVPGTLLCSYHSASY